MSEWRGRSIPCLLGWGPWGWVLLAGGLLAGIGGNATPVAAEPLRSLAEVRRHHLGDGSPEAPFDVTVTLNFWRATGNGYLYVQDEESALAVHVPPSLWGELEPLDLGARLRIVGKTIAGSRWGRAEQIEVLQASGDLEPGYAGICPGEKRIPLQRYAKSFASVDSIVRSRRQVTVRLRIEGLHYAPVFAVFFGEYETEDLLSLLGRRVEVFGTLRFPDRLRFEFMLMSRDQIRVVDESVRPSPPMDQVHGRVLFNDHKELGFC